ncbi:IPT/TIG domain-containing protein [Saccharicrinis sp. FJH62]|uniref:IPT/TIG domain-containing protein n=1 Tax=Saccharicrinis sp. FJH62 TaxID=3344657 RepID=UPI0035D472B6
MKKKSSLIRRISKLWFLPFMAVLLLWSCGGNDEPEVILYNPDIPVKVNSFVPDSGGVGTQLVIIGENYGQDPSIVSVIVNDRKATVIGVNDTRIYAVVPARAGTGTVTVILNGTDTVVSEKIFNYKLTQSVSTVCGSTDDTGHGSMEDGRLDEATFLYPYYLAIDDENNLFVVQRQGIATESTGDQTQAIRLVALSDDQVTTKYTTSGNNFLRAVEFSKTQDTLFCVNDTWDSNGLGLFTLTREQGWYDSKDLHNSMTVNGIAINPVDNSFIYSYFQKSIIRYYDVATDTRRDLTTFGEDYVLYMCFSPDGKYVYMAVSDGFQADRGKLYRGEWNFETKTIDNSELISIDYLNYPEQIACDDQGYLYICDSGNHTIEMWNPKTRTFTTFAGVRGESGYLDGLPLKSKFNSPTGICIGADGAMYIADNGNHRIRKIVIQ